MRGRGAILVAASLLVAPGCGEEPRLAEVPELAVREGVAREADRLLRQAERLLDADAPEAAEPLLREALELDPGLAAARRALASALVDQKRPAEAVPLLRELLESRPGDAALYRSLAESLREVGDLPAARAAYESWTEAAPTDDEALFGLGRVLLAEGLFEDAARAFRKAEKRRAGRADVRSELGVALQALGRLDEAEEKQRDALERDPRLAEAWFRLGDVLALGDPARRDEALDALGRAVRLNPGHLAAQVRLYALLGDAVDPGDAELDRRWRAIVRREERAQLGRRAGAPRGVTPDPDREVELRDTLAASPDDAAARRELAFLLHADGALEEALVEYETLLGGDVVPVDVLAVAGAAALALGRTDRAIELLRRATSDAAAPDAARRHLAWALLVGDRAQEALDAYDALLASDAGDDALRRGRGLALLRLGRTDEAVDVLRASGFAAYR